MIGVIAGLGWLTFIYPLLGRPLFIYIALFALAASAAKIFWLIVFGVDEEKFRAVEAAQHLPQARPSHGSSTMHRPSEEVQALFKNTRDSVS